LADGRNDISCQLREDEILLNQRLPVFRDGTEPPIFREIVESFPGDVIVDEVKWLVCPAGGSGVEIDYVRAKPRDVGGRQLFGVRPEQISAKRNGAEAHRNKESLHRRRLHDPFIQREETLKPCNAEITPVLPYGRYLRPGEFR